VYAVNRGSSWSCFESLSIFRIAVLISFGVLPCVGCHRSAISASGIAVQQHISPQPVRVGHSSILLQLTDRDEKPVSHAAIAIEGDMSHPGMAPIFSDAKEIAFGKYKGDVNFNMGGDWVLLLHIKLSDGRKIDHQIDVRGVQSN
jgi:hypothetical protein